MPPESVARRPPGRGGPRPARCRRRRPPEPTATQCRRRRLIGRPALLALLVHLAPRARACRHRPGTQRRLPVNLPGESRRPVPPLARRRGSPRLRGSLRPLPRRKHRRPARSPRRRPRRSRRALPGSPSLRSRPPHPHDRASPAQLPRRRVPSRPVRRLRSRPM